MFEYDLNNVSKKTKKLGTEKIEKKPNKLLFYTSTFATNIKEE